MLTALSGNLQKLARGWLVLLLLAIQIIFMVVILPFAETALGEGSGRATPIDQQFFYTPEKSYALISTYTAEGRDLYRLFELTGDIVYPCVYSLFLSFFISWLFKRGMPSRSRLLKLNLVPLGAGCCDILENVCIAVMVSLYPSAAPGVSWLGTAFTMLKWLLLGASLVIVIGGAAAAIKAKLAKKL